MTKKDFELIATVVQTIGAEQDILGPRPADRIAILFAFELARTNPRFDRERFLRACQPGANVRVP